MESNTVQNTGFCSCVTHSHLSACMQKKKYYVPAEIVIFAEQWNDDVEVAAEDCGGGLAAGWELEPFESKAVVEKADIDGPETAEMVVVVDVLAVEHHVEYSLNRSW